MKDIWIGVIGALGGAFIGVIGQIIGNLINHKKEIEKIKKELLFKEKIKIFDKIGELSWKNHLALTVIEQANKQKIEEGFDIIKNEFKLNIIEFAELLNRILYIPEDLRINLGKYISEFEKYVNDKNFGKEKRTKELRKDYKPFMKEINRCIEKDLNSIR